MVVAFTDGAGLVVNHASASPITLQDSVFRDGAAAVTMVFGINGVGICNVTASNVHCEGTPFSTLLSTTWRSLDVINCHTMDTDGLVVVGSAVNKRGHGIAHQRVTTGSINAGASALVTLTWTIPFGDANYTVQASVVDATAAAAALRVVHVESISSSAAIVRVENTSAGSLTGTLHVMGMHD
jgi:hypothetical protein